MPGLSIVTSTAVAGALLQAAAEGVAQRGEHPPARVVLGHLGVAGLAGGVGDRLGVVAHLVPRGRRLVRVEAGLLEQLAVVVQADAVGGDRDAVDVAVGVLGDGEHVRVEVGGVRQRFELGGDVGDLAALDEAAGVGERDLEDGGQRAAGQLGGEGGDVPLVLGGLDVDVRVWPPRTPRRAARNASRAPASVAGGRLLTLIVTVLGRRGRGWARAIRPRRGAVTASAAASAGAAWRFGPVSYVVPPSVRCLVSVVCASVDASRRCRPGAGRSSVGPLAIRTVPAGSCDGPGDEVDDARRRRRGGRPRTPVAAPASQSRSRVAAEALAAQGDRVR